MGIPSIIVFFINNLFFSLLGEKLILDIVYQMVSAISYMHAHNVLHRDLKTANIFLTKEGLVKIGDFGISKILTTRHGGGANTVLGNNAKI